MTDDQDKTLFGCIGAIVVLPLVLAYAALLEGFVAKQLWLWFIVPTFGLNPLTIPQAIGISILWGLFSPSPSRQADDDESVGDAIAKMGIRASMKPAMALIVGWIVMHWM
jgi:hypothetical protein